ncbi:MAG: HD domain-containing protein [Desulfobacterales bacterium]|nr:HD domain-containing protein [Desulfobacterales bacterium]
MIPTRDECLRLMSQYGMMSHIIDHSIEVTKVALYFAMELNKRGQSIDLDLVEAASLLHDLTKSESLKTKEDHAQTGSQRLKGMGYVRVGEVVAEHVHLARKNDPSLVTEEEIVNYADKRVEHDRIVSLEERFCDLMDRYGKSQKASEQIEQLKKATFEIENKIFSILGIDPSDLQLLQLEEDLSIGI